MSVSIIPYREIENLKPLEAVKKLVASNKYLFEKMHVEDIIDPHILKQPFIEQYFRHIFFRGTYLFFDKENNVKYVGKAKDGFYPRLMGHTTTDYRPGIGFNSSLVKIAQERGLSTDKINNKELEKSLVTLGQYSILLINVDYKIVDEVDVNNKIPGKLETLLKRAFKVEYEGSLLNTGIGRLSTWEKETKIKEILLV